MARGHSRQCTVYPRACGGTCSARSAAFHSSGLSPRVRGNHALVAGQGMTDRSIPARAGEPRLLAHLSDGRSVYPRACGGTTALLFLLILGGGLSPRVRGNLKADIYRWSVDRSIPARAGEPTAGAQAQMSARVYPRACGGTAITRITQSMQVGLSPRVRGNPGASHGAGLLFGGLSPRVRGNRPRAAGSRRQRRSIPARAGEPPTPRLAGRCMRVYPRACGGTAIVMISVW